jgi:HAD superfamily hydrolase (TIGR01509 family)
VLFDLFETLVTESADPPAGVSSVATELGCAREAFRTQWKALRHDVTVGRVSFRQVLIDIATALGSPPTNDVVDQICDERIRAKARPFAQIEPPVLAMIEQLRERDVRLGVVSNCFAEDVGAWPRCALAPEFDCAVFSFEVGLAKPDPEIYLTATRRLGVDAADACFIGDGTGGELSGAGAAGLRPFRALWFLRRWPHFRNEPCSVATITAVEDLLNVVG